MKVSFELTDHDVQRLHRFIARQKPAISLGWELTFSFLGVAAIAAIASTPALAALFAVLEVLSFGIVLGAEMLVGMGASAVYSGRYEVAIEPEGLSISGDGCEEDIGWEAVGSVVRGRKRLYVVPDSAPAFLVPSRAFESVAQAAAFRDLAMTLWLEAQSRESAIGRWARRSAWPWLKAGIYVGSAALAVSLFVLLVPVALAAALFVAPERLGLGEPSETVFLAFGGVGLFLTAMVAAASLELARRVVARLEGRARSSRHRRGPATHGQ